MSLVNHLLNNIANNKTIYESGIERKALYFAGWITKRNPYVKTRANMVNVVFPTIRKTGGDIRMLRNAFYVDCVGPGASLATIRFFDMLLQTINSSATYTFRYAVRDLLNDLDPNLINEESDGVKSFVAAGGNPSDLIKILVNANKVMSFAISHLLEEGPEGFVTDSCQPTPVTLEPVAAVTEEAVRFEDLLAKAFSERLDSLQIKQGVLNANLEEVNRLAADQPSIGVIVNRLADLSKAIKRGQDDSLGDLINFLNDLPGLVVTCVSVYAEAAAKAIQETAGKNGQIPDEWKGMLERRNELFAEETRLNMLRRTIADSIANTNAVRSGLIPPLTTMVSLIANDLEKVLLEAVSKEMEKMGGEGLGSRSPAERLSGTRTPRATRKPAADKTPSKK